MPPLPRLLLPMRLRPPAAALAALAALTLPGCDLLEGLEGFFNQPTPQEIESLSRLVDCADVRAASGTHAGALDAGDCRIDGDSFADYYALKLASASDVRIELASDDFTTYLLLWNDDGQSIEEDGGGGDARIARRLGAGLYLVAANSYDAGETGRYTLRVSRAAD